jgi:hypothetical protein
MRYHRHITILATFVALIAVGTAPPVEGGGFGVHLGGGGFGVSVGFGDWGIYTRSWADPYWSIDFNASLSGYGRWVWVDGLGRVWSPWVTTSWRPYTYGRWVSTAYGLTWVSYEPWGYIPHHYGNWAYSSFGWVWVPGYDYFCANVVWVGSGRYVGWYARPPAGWSHAAHGFRNGYTYGHRDGYASGYQSGYSDGWYDARYGTYVGWKDLGTDNVSRHAVAHKVVSQNHLEALKGSPTSTEIRRRGGPEISQTRLSRRTATMDGRKITIARPEGVATSIERHAADTVGRALSEDARSRRQPLVRPRSQTAVANSSQLRRGGDSRERLSKPSARPPRVASSSRTERSSRSTSAVKSRSLQGAPHQYEARALASPSISRSRSPEVDLRQSGKRSVPLATRQLQSVSAAQKRATSANSQGRRMHIAPTTTTLQRSQLHSRAIDASSGGTSAAQTRHIESKRSRAQGERSTSARTRPVPDEKPRRMSAQRRRH